MCQLSYHKEAFVYQEKILVLESQSFYYLHSAQDRIIWIKSIFPIFPSASFCFLVWSSNIKRVELEEDTKRKAFSRSSKVESVELLCFHFVSLLKCFCIKAKTSVFKRKEKNQADLF